MKVLLVEDDHALAEAQSEVLSETDLLLEQLPPATSRTEASRSSPP